ncbi:MAG: hypothetical protein WCP21_19895 [Armatimonadota bacterium]
MKDEDRARRFVGDETDYHIVPARHLPAPPTVADDPQTALDQWCGYSWDIPRLEQIHLREALHWREGLRRALADGLQLTPWEQAALDRADERFAAAAATVLPRLVYAGWLDRQSPEHYAHEYARCRG